MVRISSIFAVIFISFMTIYSTDIEDYPHLLSAYWNFNECTGNTFYDKSGNGNDGTIRGAVRTDGLLGRALEFTGPNTLVDIAPINLPQVYEPKTIVVLAKYDKIPDGTTPPYGIQHLIAYGSDINRTIIDLCFRNGNAKVSKFLDTTLIETECPEAKRWHLYVYTYDGSTHKYFIDFRKVGESNAIVGKGTYDMAYITRWKTESYFKGLIDEIVVFNCDLSIDFIATLYPDLVNTSSQENVAKKIYDSYKITSSGLLINNEEKLPVSVSIFDALGSRVMYQQYGIQNIINLNLMDLGAGFYTFKINIGQRQITRKHLLLK